MINNWCFAQVSRRGTITNLSTHFSTAKCKLKIYPKKWMKIVSYFLETAILSSKLLPVSIAHQAPVVKAYNKQWPNEGIWLQEQEMVYNYSVPRGLSYTDISMIYVNILCWLPKYNQSKGKYSGLVSVQTVYVVHFWTQMYIIINLWNCHWEHLKFWTISKILIWYM